MSTRQITLICPSNMLYMPYVGNYEKIFKENNADYTIINWDRFQIENKNDELKYRDEKVGHQRNYVDYFKYKKFIIKKLTGTKYDKLIIFGLQLSYFLKNYLLKNYKDKYIIDIRDYNKIVKLSNFKKLISNSTFTVISSPGFKLWLPESNKCIVNHNTQIDSLKDLKKTEIKFNKGKKNISDIGALRDYDVNIIFINSLKNISNFKLIFHGDGMINQKIGFYLKENNIKNVEVYGRYNKDEEAKLYTYADLINVLMSEDDISSKTLLPNRLYNSVLYGKPMIAFKGTYLAEQIKEYQLGLVLSSFENTAEKINQYLKQLDEFEYDKGRVSFFEKVISDNEYFKKKLKRFIGN